MDRQFISFPKSGRSWIRYALTQLGVSDKICFHHDGFEYNDGAKPSLDFDYSKRLEKYDYSKRIVYLDRDPRDVMVSLFYQITGRFPDFIDDLEPADIAYLDTIFFLEAAPQRVQNS